MTSNGFARAGAGAAATLCVVLVPASLALAGYQVGGYAGATEQGEAITFRATDDGRVKRLAAVAYAECADGTRQKITVEGGRDRIFDEGRFSLNLAGASDLTVSIAGKLRDDLAAGRIRAEVKPPGTTCAVEARWQAALAKSPARR